MEGAEPETVEVEDFDGDGACFHFFEEMRHSGFIVGGCEGSGEPEPVGPGWEGAGFASQDGVFCQDFFGGWAVDYVPVFVVRLVG